MKKILSSSVVALFIIFTLVSSPSISYASWWNPGTWFNNWTFEVKSTSNNIQTPSITPKSNLDNNSYQKIDSNKKSQSYTPTTNPSINECTDVTCFTNAIKSCSNKQYLSNSKISILGSDIESKIDFSLLQSNGSCKLLLNPLSYTITPSKGLVDSMKGGQVIGQSPADVYPKLNSDAQTKIVGKKGVCDITKNKDEIIDLITKNSGVYLIIDPDYSICSGDLFAKPVSVNDKKVSTTPKTVAECKNLGFQDDKNTCVKSLVKTITDCDVFTSLDKSMCIKQLALKKADVSICSLVGKPNDYNSIQSDCFGELAALTKDYNICSIKNFEKIKTDSDNSSRMAMECVTKYCSLSGPDRWWGCKI